MEDGTPLLAVRTPDQHPNLPVTPDQLAAAAIEAHRAGAQAVHMHPKDANGVESDKGTVKFRKVEIRPLAEPSMSRRLLALTRSSSQDRPIIRAALDELVKATG